MQLRLRKQQCLFLKMTFSKLILLLQDTGATIIEAVKVLAEHGVQEENIIFLNLFATPNGE